MCNHTSIRSTDDSTRKESTMDIPTKWTELQCGSRKADRLMPSGLGDLSELKACRRKYPIPVEVPRWKRM
ncbi:TPA: hypothetical protein N0F65_010640 [Lagenidium giganteum]|uniref:Uncharacterized protein n=1 Tax=Lagenidium giganteum TaxID=4803 RepID=A0AAV2ZFP4_9STRA|nr:TPA: hypothetical protein N0F65_010640 [Lagenidium giganteum]